MFSRESLRQLLELVFLFIWDLWYSCRGEERNREEFNLWVVLIVVRCRGEAGWLLRWLTTWNRMKCLTCSNSWLLSPVHYFSFLSYNPLLQLQSSQPYNLKYFLSHYYFFLVINLLFIKCLKLLKRLFSKAQSDIVKTNQQPPTTSNLSWNYLEYL